MRQAIILGLAMLLAGCGGGGDRYRGGSGPSGGVPMASGPLNQACLASDRKARSRALCGCIQAAANQTLNGAQQRRAVVFYNNPQLAQDVRQSDSTIDERFWAAYRAYGERAERLCS